MRNSFEAVPRELEEAAVIDGCSSWQVLVRIYLPAIRPAIVTVSLFAFVTSWNEFLAALVIMNRGVDLHPAAGARRCAPGDQHRRHGLGSAAGRDHHLGDPLHPLLRAPPEILRLGLPERRGEMKALSERPTTAGNGGPRRAIERSDGTLRPTIRDVARAASVSVGTVSKALNNNGSLRRRRASA